MRGRSDPEDSSGERTLRVSVGLWYESERVVEGWRTGTGRVAGSLGVKGKAEDRRVAETLRHPSHHDPVEGGPDPPRDEVVSGTW